MHEMRQIILDTETTGIGTEQGHRIIEIGCVELVDRKLTGKHYHVYINPQRQVDEGAFRVHGISNEFLQDKPVFKDVVSDFLQFIGGSELIIHNAPFDVGFINSELKHIKWKKKLDEYCDVLDTLVLARKKHPGQRNSLDALCKRYDVNNSNRQFHGALLDAELLAFVYLAMTGGQISLLLEIEAGCNETQNEADQVSSLSLLNPVLIQASEEELEHHKDFINFLTKKSNINYWE
jgi:DNA polymerase-3 subunit epsilon